MWIVYTEICRGGTVERWYYGRWNDHDKANEVALTLGHDGERGIYHCVCAAEDAEDLEIMNMPKE